MTRLVPGPRGNNEAIAERAHACGASPNLSSIDADLTPSRARNLEDATGMSIASLGGIDAQWRVELELMSWLVDGNKRVAPTAAAVFLEINGSTLNGSEAETVMVFRNWAAGDLSEDGLTQWIRQQATKPQVSVAMPFTDFAAGYG